MEANVHALCALVKIDRGKLVIGERLRSTDNRMSSEGLTNNQQLFPERVSTEGPLKWTPTPDAQSARRGVEDDVLKPTVGVMNLACPVRADVPCVTSQFIQ
jgi:hypothetical protein